MQIMLCLFTTLIKYPVLSSTIYQKICRISSSHKYWPLWINGKKCTVDYIVSAPKNAEIW